MGIPYYFHTLYKKYANAKLMVNEGEIAQMKVGHLFLDYNSMIHPCAQQVLLATLRNGDQPAPDTEEIETAIIENIITYTRYIVGLLRPQNMYIMIDGVAPRAKINQQRERRYKSYFLKTLSNPSSDTVQWDSNKITPGTGFMSKLRKALDVFKHECSSIYDSKLYISDSDQCGEGEHKMMKYITENLSKSTDKLFIYGLDADLIMLSLMNVARDNITLIRDNTFNGKLKDSERTFTYLDIQQLGSAIHQELLCLYKEHNKQGTMQLIKNKLISDYIFLCFMLGNDFVEHLPSLIIRENGVNILTKCYMTSMGKFEGYLVDDTKSLCDRLNLQLYVDILGQLSSCEDYFFKKIYSAYKGDGITYKDTPIDNVEVKSLHFLKEDVIRYNQDGYKQRYYKYYGISEINEACKDYIEGLHWILGYYNNHDHSNWTWYYKHHATPFVSDIYSFLKKNTKQMCNFLKETVSLKPSKPNTTLEQLCMVLPRESLVAILEGCSDAKVVAKIKRIFRTSSDVLEKYYPTMITLDMIHRECLWQSKVFFENFDKEVIELIL